jgi:hypothetical protein
VGALAQQQYMRTAGSLSLIPLLLENVVGWFALKEFFAD